MRGETLDFRSDMYAVGVTLYELLTGRLPFQGQSVAVVAQILDETAAAPSSVNPAVPKGLDRVVLRLMAKDPAKRFSSYRALREALTPFAPGVLSAGGVGRRILAFLFDQTVLTIPFLAVPQVREPGQAFGLFLMLASTLVAFLYFWGLETRFGASLGKRLLGLTVSSSGGARLGAWPIGLRTLVFLGIGTAPPVLAYALGQADLYGPVTSGLGIAATLALFVTMRPNNGFAGLHDLVSDSRVFRESRSTMVGAPERPLEASRPADSTAPEVGPYTVEAIVWSAPGARLFLARDEALNRGVWIHHYDDPAHGPAFDRLANGTPGRLGWLQGSRAEGDAWDAYAVPSGSALVEWVEAEGRLTWTQARQILRGVAQELSGNGDGASTGLALNRVWVDGAGEPKLLDFPVQPEDEGEPRLGRAAKGSLEFLRSLATYTLEGRCAPEEERPDPPRAVVPGHAHEFLTELFAEDHPPLDGVAERLEALMAETPAVTSLRRTGALLVGALIPVFFAIVGMLPAAVLETAGPLPPRIDFFVITVAVSAAVTGVAAILLAPLFAGGPVLRALDVEVRTRDGSRARRWRSAARAALAWSPFLIAAAVLPSTRSGNVQLVWMTRSGEPAPPELWWTFDPGPAGYTGWSISPDDTKVAVTRRTDGLPHVWIKDLTTGSFQRLTSDDERELYPAWSSDGQTLTYSREDPSSESEDHFDVWRARVDGSGAPQMLLDDERSILQARWSPDERWLVARTFSLPARGTGRRDIVGFQPGRDSASVSLVATDNAEQGASISPDGRWLAYSSDESGRDEVYVRPFPEIGSGVQQISTSGGIAPRWAHSGRELFYVDEDRSLVAVAVEARAELRIVGSEPLFTIPIGYLAGSNFDFYDVAAGDDRFLMGRPLQLATLLVLLGAIVLWGIGVAFTVANPQRGPHDRIAGTYLVPR